MKNFDKKYLSAAIIIITLVVLYTSFESYIKNSIKIILIKEWWVNWLTVACLVIELLHKWKDEKNNIKVENLFKFIKDCKDWIDVLVESGILICAVHLFRGCILYLFFDDKGFFPRYPSVIVVFIFLVSLFASILSVLKLIKHFKKVFLHTKSEAGVAADDALLDE
jgi:hypothetical protein